jgi:CHASE2 domain-containing sensor protein/signal transduction histidine kinase
MKPLSNGFRARAEWWLIGLFLSALIGALTIDRTMERFDNLIYDHLLRVNPVPVSEKILIVAIDDESLRRIGRWPWNRDMHARLIGELREAEPRAMAYDVLFTEAGSQSGDDRLTAAMKNAGPLFVPLSFDSPGENGASFEAIEPIPSIRAAADGIGHVNLSFDPDGVVRHAAMSFGAGQHQWQHLMALVARAASSSTAAANSSDAGPLLIPFAGGTGHWPTVSAASVIQGEVPAELLHDRLILVGATASALGDRYAVPMGSLMPGVEIEAHLLNGLLSGEMIGTASTATLLAFGLVPLWLLMMALRRLPRSTSLICTCIVALLVLLSSAAALIVFRIWMPPAAALAGLCICYLLWIGRQLASADAFMSAELKRFEAEPDLILQGAAGRYRPGGDSTVEMLHRAIGNAREMRHFIFDRLDQLPDAILITDMAGEVLLANAAARRLFDSLGVPGQDRTTLAGLLKQFSTGPDRETLALPGLGFEPDSSQDWSNHEVSADDGRTFSIGFAPQTSSAVKPSGWVVRISDISEAKAAQRQREDILQLLTHDMRSPQASIVAVLETAAPEHIDPEVSARIRHYAQRTLGLADDFVQLARAEALDYAIEEVDLYDMLMDAIDDLWPQLTAKDISLETVGGGEHLVVLGERSLLTRALTNVIGNALKYSGPGTRIICSLSRTQTADGRAMAACAIADEGPGLAPAHRKTIFERFNRGPLGAGGKVDGVGLGLSFVHTVIVRHKGEVRCESEPGQGATFTLLFPLAIEQG